MKVYKNHSLENLSTVFDGQLFFEEWKEIKIPIRLHSEYQISSFGRIKRIGRLGKTFYKKRIPDLIIAPQKKKYLWFSRQNSEGIFRCSVHRLVAQYFLSNYQLKPQVNHIDTDKWNNFYKNLEWCTQSENNRHSLKLSHCYQKGTAHVTYEDRNFIRENMNEYNREELAERFKITTAQVYNIGTNRDTLLLENKKVEGNRKNRKQTEPNYKWIIDLNTGVFYTSAELATLLGTTRKSICRLISEEAKPNKTSYRYA